MVLPGILLRAMLVAVVAGLGACASHPRVESAPAVVAATLQGDAARPAQASGWVRSELYFGVGEETGPADRPQAGPISEVQWRAFLDREVTPRFPDGLTVFDAYGQWLFRGAREPNRLDTRVLVILHEDTPQRRRTSRRSGWRGAVDEESVRCWWSTCVGVSF